MMEKRQLVFYFNFREVLITIICSILACIAFSTYYALIETELFAYLDRPQLPNNYITSLLPILPLVIIAAIVTSLKKKSHCSIMLDYLFVFFLIPSFIISAAQKGEKDWIVECLIKLVVFIIFSLSLGNQGSFVFEEKSQLKSLKKYIIPAIIFICVTFFAYNLSTTAFDINRIYEVRLEARDQSSGGSSLSDHTPNFLIYFFGPIIMALGVGFKNKWLIILGGVSIIVPFMAIASKSAVFLMIIACFVGFMHNKIHIYKHWHLPLIMIILILIAQFAYLYLEDVWFPSFFSRMFIIPSISTEYYIHFAHNHGLFYFEDWNFISSLYDFLGVNKSFSDSKGFVIGLQYYPGSFVNLNSTIWANAYLDLGIIGVVIVSILFAQILRLLSPHKKDTKVDQISKIVIMYVYTYLAMEKSINGYILGAGLVFTILYYLPKRFKILSH